MIVTWPLSEDTGYTVNARRAIAALVAHGVDVRVIQVVHRSQASEARRCGEHLTVTNVPDRAAGVVRAVLRAHRDRSVRRHVKRLRPDVIHARGTRAGEIAGRCANAAPYVLDVRGDVLAEVRDHTDSHRMRAIETIERIAFDDANGFIFVSHGMADWAGQQHGISSKPFVIVPCSVDAEGTRQDTSVSDSSLSLAYAGGMQDYQSPELVFSALERVRVLAGADRVDVWTADERDEVMAARDALCPTANVSKLAADDVLPALTKIDVGIIPRALHPLNLVACPTKLAEYLAAGVPVGISSALPEWHDLVLRNDVGFSLDADDDEVRRFCERVRSERAEFRARCCELARREFSMRSGAERITRFYRDLLGRTA